MTKGRAVIVLVLFALSAIALYKKFPQARTALSVLRGAEPSGSDA